MKVLLADDAIQQFNIFSTDIIGKGIVLCGSRGGGGGMVLTEEVCFMHS